MELSLDNERRIPPIAAGREFWHVNDLTGHSEGVVERPSKLAERVANRRGRVPKLCQSRIWNFDDVEHNLALSAAMRAERGIGRRDLVGKELCVASGADGGGFGLLWREIEPAGVKNGEW